MGPGATSWKLAVSNGNVNAHGDKDNPNKQHQASTKGPFTAKVLYKNADSRYD